MINLLYYKKISKFQLKKLCFENQSIYFSPLECVFKNFDPK
jgi:hypothetical protein